MMKHRVFLGALLLSGLTACGGDDAATPDPAPTPPATSDIFQLDTSAGACVDLNAYVNNHWVQTTELRPDLPYLTTLGEISETTRQQLRELLETPAAGDAPSSWRSVQGLFQDGMNVAELERLGFEPAREEWDRIAALSSKAELRHYLQERLLAGTPILVAAYVSGDLSDPGRNILYFAYTDLGLPTRDYFIEPVYAPVAAAYETLLSELMMQAGVPEPTARERARWAFEVEQQLARHHLSPIEGANPNNRYQLVTASEAARLAPDWEWSGYLNHLGLDAGAEFSLHPGSYFPELGKLIETLPLEHWQAYLQAQWVREMGAYLNGDVRALLFNFYGKALEGRETPSERWQEVLRTVSGQMGEPLGQAYVENLFDARSKGLALDIVERVRAVLRKRLQEVDWMGEATRAEALAKMDAMTFAIAYPDTWNDWSDLQLQPGQYFANISRLNHYNFHQRELVMLGPVPEVPPWGDWPHTVNAYYSPTENHMVFLAAILQSPILQTEADMAVNLGAFGAVVGHEITHAFDSGGSQFDATGMLRNWWTEEDRAAFEVRAAVLRDQAAAVLPWPHMPELTVDGELTLNENIADLGGLSAAYDALQAYLAEHPEARQPIDGLSPEQRLFLSWTQAWRSKYRVEALRQLLEVDVHAPGPVRVKLPVQNLPAFAQAFQCEEGDPMVLPAAEQVRIW